MLDERAVGVDVRVSALGAGVEDLPAAGATDGDADARTGAGIGLVGEGGHALAGGGVQRRQGVNASRSEVVGAARLYG